MSAIWETTVERSRHEPMKFGWVLRRNGKLYQASGAAFATREAAIAMAKRTLATLTGDTAQTSAETNERDTSNH